MRAFTVPSASTASSASLSLRSVGVALLAHALGDVLLVLAHALGLAVDRGVASCTLKKSTGHEILDQRALAIVRYAASNVPIPEGLRGVAFSTEVRLRFTLQPPGKRAGEQKA